MSKRILALAALIGAVLLGWGLIRSWRARNSAMNTAYETVAVRRDTLVATVDSSGRVRAKRQLNLTFPVGGVLDQMLAEPGQHVEAGQSLASLDTRQLELNLRQAQATLQASEARLAQAEAGAAAADITAAEAAEASARSAYESAKEKWERRDDQLAIVTADLKRAELALQDAQAAYDRVAWRPEIGMLPQAAALERATLDYQRALSNYNLQLLAIDDAALKGAAAQLAQAEAQLQRLRSSPTAEELTIAWAQVEQSRTAVEQAELRLQDAVLQAPIAGTVLSTNAEAGELVGASMPVIVLADLSGYYVDASIDEADVGRTEEGQDAIIILDAFPDVELRGRVIRVAAEGQVTQGVVTYEVRVQVLPTEVGVRPNMTALVQITVSRKPDVLVVPNRAIKRDSGGRLYLQVLEGGEVEARTVVTGLSNDVETEIVSGVLEGEEAVVSAPRENVLSQFGQGFRLGGS